MPLEVQAKNKTFTFPDGTSADDIGIAIDEYFSKQDTTAIDTTALP